MQKLSNISPPQNLISFGEAFEKFRSGKGLIITVFERKISFLQTDIAVVHGEGAGCAFTRFHPNVINTWTKGDTFDIEKRISTQSTEVEYFYFETLKELAAAILENNWAI